MEGEWDEFSVNEERNGVVRVCVAVLENINIVREGLYESGVNLETGLKQKVSTKRKGTKWKTQ